MSASLAIVAHAPEVAVHLLAKATHFQDCSAIPAAKG